LEIYLFPDLSNFKYYWLETSASKTSTKKCHLCSTSWCN